MIINIDNEQTLNCPLVHIHGTEDHTIPVRNVRANLVVKGGSHMMVLTNAGLVNELLAGELEIFRK